MGWAAISTQEPGYRGFDCSRVNEPLEDPAVLRKVGSVGPATPKINCGRWTWIHDPQLWIDRGNAKEPDAKSGSGVRAAYPAEISVCPSHGCRNDSAQALAFLLNLEDRLVICHLSSHEHVDPDLRFVQFLQDNSELVDEIPGTFCAPSFSIIWCG